MSFEFPKPIPGSTNTSSDSDSGYELDEIHVKLMRRRSGPHYDELIIPLSLYAFNRLSPSDQQEQLVEIRSHHEESDFTELFKKLNYSDQVKFLSQVLQKLKFQRLIPSFKQLNAEHQQLLIEQITDVSYYSGIRVVYRNHLGYAEAEDELPDSVAEETEEDFRLRKFTQLCKRSRHTRDAHNIMVAWKSGGEQPAEETSDEYWKLRFSDFFIGFSSIWFQGQFASGQDMLIEQLSKGVAGGVMEKCMQKKSEEDFKLRRFTELCTKVTDFGVQEKFLDIVGQKLSTYDGWSLEPQDYEGAAKLFSDLSTLGFSRLSAKHQYQMIEEMSNQVKRHLAAEDLQTNTADPDEEAIRIGRFTELFNQVSVQDRIHLFTKLRISLKHKQYSEAVQIFCGLDTMMFYEFSQHEEKFLISSFERKEDSVDYLSIRDDTLRTEADKDRRVQQGASQDSEHNQQESPYAEFLIDASIFWFKARCANFRKNPIHVILSGEVEETEKLRKESDDDFRLTRFTESFMRLPLGSQERIFNCMHDKLITDLGYGPMFSMLQSSNVPSEGRDSFASEWIKMKLPDLQRQGAAATTPPVVSAAGSATTTRWTLFKRFFK